MGKVKRNKLKIVDYKYNDPVVSKFVNSLMMNGKKSIALSIMYGALDVIKSKVSDEEPLKVFHEALSNVKPMLEIKSKRIGGSTYQVPIEVSKERQATLSRRWIISGARKRHGKSMASKLSAELLDAHKSTGFAYKKMEETHRMAESNKPFLSY